MAKKSRSRNWLGSELLCGPQDKSLNLRVNSRFMEMLKALAKVKGKTPSKVAREIVVLDLLKQAGKLGFLSDEKFPWEGGG